MRGGGTKAGKETWKKPIKTERRMKCKETMYLGTACRSEPTADETKQGKEQGSVVLSRRFRLLCRGRRLLVGFRLLLLDEVTLALEVELLRSEKAGRQRREGDRRRKEKGQTSARRNGNKADEKKESKGGERTSSDFCLLE
jgi:hypothetical protein